MLGEKKVTLTRSSSDHLLSRFIVFLQLSHSACLDLENKSYHYNSPQMQVFLQQPTTNELTNLGVCVFVYLCVCVLLLLVWFGLFCFGLVWFGLVWFGLFCFGLFWFVLVWFGLVCFGLFWFVLVWFGLFIYLLFIFSY